MAAAKKFRGVDFIFEIETEENTWKQVCGLTQTGMTINAESVDVTDNCSEGWREMLEGAGIRSMSITASGNANDSETQLFLTAAIMADQFISARIRRGYGDEFAGVWHIPSNGFSAAHNGAETFEVTLESAGEITYTPPVPPVLLPPEVG
jgi:TP901-1 family phage major tail protein